MRWIRRLFLLMCLVTACLLVWAGIHARKHGFTESWRNAIEREFTERGYYVEIGKITLGAFRGLVAEDVTFFYDDKKSEPIAFLDDVFLDVDLSRIWSKEVSVNTLDVEDASLSLPLDASDPGGRRLEVDNLSGRIVVTESVIEIVKAEAAVSGFDLDIKGTLVRARKESEEDDGEEKKKRDLKPWRHQLQGVLRELDKYEFAGDRPRISIEFSGDLEDLADTTAKLHMEAGEFARRGNAYAVSALSVRADYSGLKKTARIEEFLLRDEKGELTLTGDWSQETNRFNFSAQSGADLSSIVGLFWKDRRLREVVFFQPPEVRVDGHLEMTRLGKEGVGFPGEVIGEFQADRFVTRGEVFAGLDFGYSFSGNRIYFRNLRLDHQSGVAFLNLKYEPGTGPEALQYQTEIKLDPHVFRPFFREGARKFVDSWRFDESSTVYFAAAGNGSSGDPKTWKNKGVIDLRNFRLNGVSFLEMEAEMESEGTLHWFRDVKMKREDGEIRAEVAEFNPVVKMWEVKGVVSTTDLEEGARAFSPRLAETLSKYQFESPPTVRLAGQLDARRPEEVGSEPRRNKLEISFESEATARYSFLGETITAERSSGSISVDRSRVHLTSLQADIFGGSFELAYDAKNVRSPQRPFEATVLLKDVPLEAITLLYGDTETIRGRVEAVLALSGNAGDITTLDGQGTASISNGNLFSIPLFGPLSTSIAKARPGQVREGANVAREARATLRIEDGVIRSDDFEALTDSFRVRAAGDVSLVDLTVDLEAVVNTKGALSSTVLTPVSELLTFSCTGTVTEPVWKAKHISNLGKVPAQVITDLTTIPVEGLKKIGQGIFGVQGDSNAVGSSEESIDSSAGGDKKPGLLNLIPGFKGKKPEPGE
jgi:hypothetical protein